MKRKLLALLLIFIIARPAMGGAGKSSALFLKIVSGAKPVSLGGTYTAGEGDINCLYFNPAGLASLNSGELSVTRGFWLEDISFSSFIGGFPFAGGYWAFSLSSLNAGDIPKYDFMGNDLGESFSPTDISPVVAYSRSMGNFSAGAAFRWISSDIDGHRGEAFSSDAGIQHSRGSITYGLSLQNAGTKIKFREIEEDLPLILRGGISFPYTFIGLGGRFMADISSSSDIPFQAGGGIIKDFPISIEHGDWSRGYSTDTLTLSLRAGIKSYAPGLDFLSRLSGGVGAEYLNWSLSYGASHFGQLGMVHIISLGYGFGTDSPAGSWGF